MCSQTGDGQMVQLTRAGTAVSASAGDVEHLRRQFDRLPCILLPSLLDPGLLHVIQRHIDAATFNPKTHEGIGTEICLTENQAVYTLRFLANDPQLFEVIQQITGCGRIGCFDGRVYRMVPGSQHYDSWHDDMIEHRMIGMSINLSPKVYSGGIFQIHNRNSLQIIHETANTGFGDGIIFRLAPHLQHRITEVDGSVPKTAFAGWFRSEPDFYADLKNAPQQL